MSQRSRCSSEGCHRDAKRKGKCWTCLKRDQRKSESIRPPRGVTPRDLLAKAALKYADAEEDADFRRALDLLCKHALKYAIKAYGLVRPQSPTDSTN